MAENAGLQQPLVLVIEDEPMQRLALVDLLEEAGFGVVQAWDAGSAVALLETRSDVRLVVTDIEMPGAMNGVELAAAIRDRWPPIALILVSAGVTPKAEDLPPHAEFMPKPIQAERMFEALRRMTA